MISKVSGLAFVAVALLFISGASAWGHDEPEHKRVLLSDVQTLTLYHDKKTTGRRSSPVPQLKCNSGYSLCHEFAPHAVQCYNKGTDGMDAQWECTAQLDSQVKFDVLKVSCEGFDSANDPYILAGSCGLEYTFAKTGVKPTAGHSTHKDTAKASSTGFFGGIMKFIFSIFAFGCAAVAASIYAIYHFCIKSKSTPAVRRTYTRTDSKERLYPNLHSPPSYEHATSHDGQSWGDYIQEGGTRLRQLFRAD